MMIPNLECARPDCAFTYICGASTAMYCPTVVDKNGKVISVDMNTHSECWQCNSCGDEWCKSTRAGATEWKKAQKP